MVVAIEHAVFFSTVERFSFRLAVTLPDGTEFAVGSGLTDAQREHPPEIGSTITFRYQELTDGGVPRFPSFVRVRCDLSRPELGQSI